LTAAARAAAARTGAPGAHAATDDWSGSVLERACKLHECLDASVQKRKRLTHLRTCRYFDGGYCYHVGAESGEHTAICLRHLMLAELSQEWLV